VPTTVEALQLSVDNISWAAQWCRGVENVKPIDGALTGAVTVPTLYGAKTASMGDYIFKTPSGDFNVSDKIAFESKYELEKREEDEVEEMV